MGRGLAKIKATRLCKNQRRTSGLATGVCKNGEAGVLDVKIELRKSAEGFDILTNQERRNTINQGEKQRKTRLDSKRSWKLRRGG